MIQEGDLRPGIIFQVNWSKEIRRADILDLRDITEKTIVGGVSAIPLSPEVLEQWFGFETLYKGKVYGKEGTIIQLIEWEDAKPEWKISTLNSHDLFYWKTKMPTVDYLHQLQNDWYSIYRTELEVKLPSPLHETQNK